MAAADLNTKPAVAVAATSTPSPPPGPTDDGYATGRFTCVRTLCQYAGTVTAATVRLWVRDPSGLGWFRGCTTDDLDPLTPGGASPVNEARDWMVGRNQVVLWQVTAVSGGGTVAVLVQGIDR